MEFRLDPEPETSSSVYISYLVQVFLLIFFFRKLTHSMKSTQWRTLKMPLLVSGEFHFVCHLCMHDTSICITNQMLLKHGFDKCLWLHVKQHYELIKLMRNCWRTWLNVLVPVNPWTVPFSSQSLDFPVITVCNFNALRKDAIESLPDELRKDIEEETAKKNSKFVKKKKT